MMEKSLDLTGFYVFLFIYKKKFQLYIFKEKVSFTISYRKSNCGKVLILDECSNSNHKILDKMNV